MTTLELYTKGARVWIPHNDKVWEGAELCEDYTPTKQTVKVLTEENSEEKILQIKTEQDLPFLRNPTILIGENDLTSLSYLHEPAVLYNLQVRFVQNKYIYTYCGIVLVAINPYDELPIYDIDTIQTYRGQAMGDLDPHIFAVAEEAYTKLEREQRDQSIIVSGESGAGKTVSAKYAMRYFATVGGNATETQIEKKVLASSPIMEAIGNAKTIRNDNSSRFGKFIELQFNKQFHISGASMRTYLLEKSRVVFQAPHERNYHIFYQLCSAHKQLPHLQLTHQNNFNYLNQGDSPTIDEVDDLATFAETKTALTLLGFTKTDQENMFRILAAVLHLGNIEFNECIIKVENEQDQEGCTIATNNKHLEMVAELLEVDRDEIERWLVTRKLVSMREVFLKAMSIDEAQASRDALAKHIYAELFNWVVLIINKALISDVPRHKFIGVLDIYGFETFETNSFEQFCINYANEKLQQQFNLHVFKLEQEEYIREGIAWSMIDFYDNQPCIDLIEAKLGVLDLLDEECRMPKGSDSSWTEKLYHKCVKYSNFGKARFGTSAFTINHFASTVQYESTGFLEKNRDTVIDEQISVIKRSKNSLVNVLFKNENQKLAVPGTKVKIVAAKTAPTAQKSNKKTVGSQFRDSLNLLMQTLNATTPHYVRCIKPNDSKTSFAFDSFRAVQQLRACGVLETIRLSAAGFPSRWSYIDFFYRYRVLCRFCDIIRNDMQATCQKILTVYIKKADMYQFGKTKIFFRAGQVAYLEKLRGDKLKACCIMMQKTIRTFINRKKYLRIRKSTILIQRYGRGVIARKLAQEIREKRAAIRIQSLIRGWLVRRRYNRTKHCILGLQARSRGYLSRLRFMALKYNAKAVIIQRFCRGYLARKEIQAHKKRIVICQSAIRRFLARRQYRKLRIEARSIDHVKKLNKGLENKIISLQQKIGDIQKNNVELQGAKNEVVELKSKLLTFKALQIEIKNLNNLLLEKNKSITKLEAEFKAEKEEKIDLLAEHEKYREEIEKRQNYWDHETAKLRKELDNMYEIVKTNQEGADKTLHLRLEEEKLLIMNEQDSDREAYQKLLQQYHNLEQHCEDLEKQNSTQIESKHRRNVSDLSSIASFNDDNVTLETSSKTPSSSSQELEKVDIGLVLKLQHKLAEIEREKQRMQNRLDEFDQSPRLEKAENAVQDSIRIAELELLNSNLKTRLLELENVVVEGCNPAGGGKKLQEQIHVLQTELERKTEEVVQLKSVLANQTSQMKSIVNSNSRPGGYISEDGELALAFETQKTINKQLELELQDEKAMYKAHEKEYKLEIEKLCEDNERQQRLLAENLTNEPHTQSEAFMQHEIARLSAENLSLHDQNDNFGEMIRKLKKQLKQMEKRLREAGIEVNDVERVEKVGRLVPNIRRKDREYLGMFSYVDEDEAGIVKQLVIGLKPRTAVTLLPGLPAYILFMCIRYTDYVNDENKVRALLSSFSNNVKKLIKKRGEDFETTALWLTNTLRLVHNLKQYSGDRVFQQKNTTKQNDQCLKNFDLTDYRQILSDIAVEIYKKLVANFATKVQPMIVPAFLEHEEIPGLSGIRGRSSSVTQSPQGYTKPTTALLQELSNHHKILTFYGVDEEVVSQLFRQMFYFMTATSLNNLLCRKELCHWNKGIQIRHNLANFEMWTREKEFDESAIQASLQPLIQAAHLLQARKTEADVASVCEMCQALSALQICKILEIYTPVDEFEQRVPKKFIQMVEEKLMERQQSQTQQTLLMDTNYAYPVRFPFNYSSICLEDIEIPEILKLPQLEKI